MKKTLSLLLLAALYCATFSSRVSASQPAPPLGFYAKLDMGASWINSTDVKDLFGPVAPGTTIDFDTGFRLGLDLGYQVTPWFSGEFEIATTWNRVKSIS